MSALKQMDYAVCKQAILAMLPPENHSLYLRLFDAMEGQTEKSFYAGLATVMEALSRDEKEIKTESLFKGMMLGINLCLISMHPGMHSLLSSVEDGLKKKRGENVEDFLKARAKRGVHHE